MPRYRSVRTVLALLIVLVATFSALPAHVAFAATTITDCSNPDAIEAQLEAGGDFVFNCGTVTITFNHEIDVNKRLSINGGGTTTFSIGNTSYMFVNGNQNTFSVTGLTVSGSGTAIQNNHGFVTIADSTFLNNQKVLVSLDGILSFRNSTFSGSTLGAIELWSPITTVSIVDCTFISNSSTGFGGALSIHGNGNTALSISGGSFSDNYAARGAAIYIDNDSSQSQLPSPKYVQATIDGVDFNGNSGALNGGVIWIIEADLTITNSTFSNNQHSAIVDNGPPGQFSNMLSISGSSFTGNKLGPALLLERGAASITNSTFSGNTTAMAVGIAGNIAATFTISSSTFFGNGSSGAIAIASGTGSIGNSIIDAGSDGIACSGSVSSDGHNIASDATCAFNAAGDRNSTAPLLSPLANNGGPTQTHLLLSGSPAIDAGSCPGLTSDQRGVTRPQGSACDIGAVEDDSSLPETSFVNPPAFTGATGGPFSFSSSEAGSTFQCLVDSGTFSACANPASFPGLSEGTHTLQVRAVDQSGELDPTPANLTWIVDTTPPETNDPIGPGPVTNNATATFTLSGSDANGIDHFVCFVRNGEGQKVSGPADCSSPVSFTLTVPPYVTGWSLTVSAVDKAGNADPTPVFYVWRTDLFAPVTSLDSTPPKASLSAAATFTFSATDNYSLSNPTFQCKLDGAEFSACTSPLNYSGLADGSHTFVVRAIDQAGNVDTQPQSYTWTIDSGPPDTSILTMPGVVSNLASPSFTFSGSDASGIASFECKLDNAAFAACTSPRSLTSLNEGSHTFQVRAIDTSGQTDPSPASYTWTVDTTSPDTTLLSQPSALTNSTSASFTFSGSDTNAVTFACKLDSAAFAPCVSPAQYANLTGGAHTFQVRATDAAGNVDSSPAGYTWTVDVTTPDTTILTTPFPASANPSPSFTFSGSDANGVASFECKLDGGAFNACASPLALSGLNDGSHTFQVRAIDSAGNVDPTPAGYTWLVDTLPPDTTILTMPTSVSNVIAPAFTFSGSDANGVGGFECKLDSGTFAPCTSPQTLSTLADGVHTFQVRAIDTATHSDPSPANYTWTVDNLAPDTSLLTGPPALSGSNTASFTFSGSDLNGVAGFQCKLDSGTFVACSSPAQYASLSDGPHTFQVRAIDKAGNSDSSPATSSWIVDATAPDTTILTTPAALSAGSGATFTFAGSDTNGVASFQCKLDNGDVNPCASPLNLSGLSDGSHTFAVASIDQAGNVDASPATSSWIIDTLAPDTSILTSPASISSSTAPSFSFSGSDANGVGGFECSLDSGSFAACTSPANLTGLADGTHSYQVRAIDAAGHADPSPASYTWAVDTTAPDTSVLTSPPALSGSASASFTFSGSDLNGVANFQCALDSAGFTACASPAQYTNLSDGTHTFQVRGIDAAGNIDPSPAGCSWTVDATAPDTTMLTTPATLSGSAAANFTFSGSDANGVGSFECKLDAGSFAGCVSPLALTGLGDGSHTLQVRAIDAAGNRDASPASYTWTVDTLPPDTSILTTPPSISNSATPSFTFSGSDTSGISGFECALDSGAFAACASPANLTGLSDGAHTFQVRASDNAGWVDPSPSGYSWTVDLIAPDTTITATPAALSNNPAPAFTFNGSDQYGVTGYQCKLDSADFAACTSPMSLAALADGVHTFQVRAVDAAGNLDPSPASYTWTVDTTAPTSNPSLSGTKTNGWFVNSVSISLAANDLNGVASISYAIDTGSWQRYAASFSVTGNGAHTIAYYAVDAAGNTETTRTVTVNVDATAPLISISAPSSGQPYVLNSVVMASFTCSDPSGSGIASCVGSAAAGSPLDTSSSTSRTFTVSATDKVGKTTTQSVSYTVGYAFSVVTSGSGGYGGSTQVFAGQSVSVKFTLGGNFGLNVLRSGYPQMQQVSCTNGAAIGSALTLPVVSGLQYTSGGYYQIVWKTQSSWAGKCYQVVLGLNDGSTYRLTYRFTSMPGS